VLIVFLILNILFENRSISAFLALIYSTVSTLWNVSVTSEVYSLYAFFAGLLILLALLFRKSKDLRYFYLFLFTFSLALTNHIAIVFVFLPLLILVIHTFLRILKKRKISLGKIVTTSIVLSILGLSVYIYLPIRASKDPTVNWSDTKNFRNFIYQITFKEHRTVALKPFSLVDTLQRSKNLFIFFLRQFPMVISIFYLVFGLYGFLALNKYSELLSSFLLIILLNIVYIVFLNQVPLTVTSFGFPSYIVTTLLICSGIYQLTLFCNKRYSITGLKTASVFILIVLFVIGLVFNYHENYRNHNYCAYQFIKNLMLTPTKDAALFVDGDNQTFLSLYMRGVEGFRKDLNLYSYTFSVCHNLDSFTGFIYHDKNGAFHPRDIEKKFGDNDIYYSADPTNLKHTKNPLVISGTLYKNVKEGNPIILDQDIWLYQQEDCFLNTNIFKDILTRELTSKYYLRKGDYEFFRGNIDKAKENLQIASNEGKDIYFILYEIGLQYIKMDQKDEAENLLKQAIESKKDFIEAYLSLSDVLRAKNQYPDAIAVLYNAFSMDSTDSLICGKLGETLNEMDEFEKAIVFLDKSIKYKPDDPINYYNLGNSKLGLGDYKSAASNYNLAISMGIKEPEVFNNLGNALKASGDFYGALSKYEYALSINPDFVPALNNLGLVLTNLKQYEHAAESYKKALNLDPEYAGIYCNLGSLYNDYLKDPKKAEYYWTKYISLAPETRQAGVIAAKLAQIKIDQK
jgi:tetratricopeptide (TPR) repeat protein